MNTVFSALIDKDYEKSTLNIISFNKQIKLDIHHKYYIDIKFELELNLNKEDSSNDKNICFKKLEDKIKLLEIKNDQLTNIIYELKDYIDTNMHLCIYNNEENCTNIPINSPNIIIYISDYNCNKLKISNENICGLDKLVLQTNCNTYPNTIFKGIKCRTLELIYYNKKSSIYTLPFRSSLPLPLTLQTLIIKGFFSIPSFEFTNLINLELIECNIEFIYGKISHLKTLKNIIIIQCNNFKEYELLISKGYNVKISHDL